MMPDSLEIEFKDYWSTIDHPSGLLAECPNGHFLRHAAQNNQTQYGDYVVKVVDGVHYRMCLHCTREGLGNVITSE